MVFYRSPIFHDSDYRRKLQKRLSRCREMLICIFFVFQTVISVFNLIVLHFTSHAVELLCVGEFICSYICLYIR